jgi:hypothetical protein
MSTDQEIRKRTKKSPSKTEKKVDEVEKPVVAKDQKERDAAHNR